MLLASLLFPSSRAAVEREEGWWPVDALMSRRTQSGETVSAETAMQLGPYFACLRNVSEDLGKLPLVVCRHKERGSERLPAHPIFRLLHDAPSDQMSSMTFRETLTHWAMAWGNGFAEIQRDGTGRVVALWPIHPSRVKVTRLEGGQIAYDVRSDISVSGQTYRVVRLPADDVFHIHGLGDGLVGYSVVRLAAESLGMTIAAQTFGAAFFGNGASMSGVLEHPGKLEDKARTNLRESWQAMYGGAKNAAKTAILEEGMKYTRIGIPPDEAQFLETRQFQTVEVCRWFRMPPHKIQSLERSTFTNIESQNQEYVNDTLMAWAVRWEQEIRRKLIPNEPDVYAKFIFAALLRGDQTARANFYRSQVNIGAMTPNEVRELEDMNPLGAEADRAYMQSNMMPLGSVGTETARGAPGRPAQAGEQPDDDHVEADEASVREASLESHVADVRPLVADAANRVLHREAAAVPKAAERYRGNPAHFSRWADEFYTEQASYLAEAMAAPVAVLSNLAAKARGHQGSTVDVSAFAREHAKRSRAACVASLGAELEQTNTVDNLTDAVVALVVGSIPADGKRRSPARATADAPAAASPAPVVGSTTSIAIDARRQTGRSTYKIERDAQGRPSAVTVVDEPAGG